jgi:fatty acid-binding protein DegV
MRDDSLDFQTITHVLVEKVESQEAKISMLQRRMEEMRQDMTSAKIAILNRRPPEELAQLAQELTEKYSLGLPVDDGYDYE